MCLHQTLSVVVHCMGPRATSLSFGALQSTRGPLPIVNVGPSRADSSRSTPRTKGDEASLRVGARQSREHRGRRSCEPPSFFHHKREEVASLPLNFLSQCLWWVLSLYSPLIPIIPFPHLACQNTDGWDWGQADGQSTCPTAAPPTPVGIWEERLYARSPGHGTRRLLRVAGRFPPGVGGARPDFVCCFVV